MEDLSHLDELPLQQTVTRLLGSHNCSSRDSRHRGNSGWFLFFFFLHVSQVKSIVEGVIHIQRIIWQLVIVGHRQVSDRRLALIDPSANLHGRFYHGDGTYFLTDFAMNDYHAAMMGVTRWALLASSGLGPSIPSYYYFFSSLLLLRCGPRVQLRCVCHAGPGTERNCSPVDRYSSYRHH